MDNVMQLVNALNAVAQAIDRLSQKDVKISSLLSSLYAMQNRQSLNP